MAEPRKIDPESLKPRLERAFDFAARQVRATIERTSRLLPHLHRPAAAGSTRGELWTDWCGGFHAGMMWLIAERTGDPWWRQTGRALLAPPRAPAARPRRPRPRLHLPEHLPALVSGRPATSALRQVLITAGRTLALRFNPKGQYLRSFVAPESLFIDIMMNVPIIFYAARETGDQALYDLAVGPLPDHRADARPPRRRHGARGDLRPRDRRVPPPVDPPGAPRRLGLDPRAGLVALRLRHGLHATRRTRPTWPSPTRNADHYPRPAAPRAWSPPGTSTSPPAPTGSTTARPARSPPRASGTWPQLDRRRPDRPAATATPR